MSKSNPNAGDEEFIQFEHNDVPVRVLYPNEWKNNEGRKVAEKNGDAALIDVCEGVNDDLEVSLWFHKEEAGPDALEKVDMPNAYSFERADPEFEGDDSDGDMLITFVRPLPSSPR